MYCNHCQPCPAELDIASVTKYLDLVLIEGEVRDTARGHYESLSHYAGECIQCGACEKRCPFGVNIRENMQKASKLFGK